MIILLIIAAVLAADYFGVINLGVCYKIKRFFSKSDDPVSTIRSFVMLKDDSSFMPTLQQYEAAIMDLFPSKETALEKCGIKNSEIIYEPSSIWASIKDDAYVKELGSSYFSGHIWYQYLFMTERELIEYHKTVNIKRSDVKIKDAVSHIPLKGIDTEKCGFVNVNEHCRFLIPKSIGVKWINDQGATKYYKLFYRPTNGFGFETRQIKLWNNEQDRLINMIAETQKIIKATEEGNTLTAAYLTLFSHERKNTDYQTICQQYLEEMKGATSLDSTKQDVKVLINGFTWREGYRIKEFINCSVTGLFQTSMISFDGSELNIVTREYDALKTKTTTESRIIFSDEITGVSTVYIDGFNHSTTNPLPHIKITTRGENLFLAAQDPEACAALSNLVKTAKGGLFNRNQEEKPQVFISYRRTDGEDKAGRLKLSLEAKGFKVFLDRDDIRDGNWRDKIENGIVNSRAMIVLLTSDYVSPNRFGQDGDSAAWEVSFATENGIKVIPVIFGNEIDEREMPELFHRMETQVSRIHGDYYEECVEQIVKYRLS